MNFARAEYLPYLALVVALFQFVPARLRVLAMLAASYWFYAWWSVPFTALLLASTLLDYLAALGLAASASARGRKAWLVASVVLNLGLLAYFKYAGFAVEMLNGLSDALLGSKPFEWHEVALPLGISFYTFQTMSYTIDVYRRRIEPCRDFAEYALYVAFFPQLVAGPIERAGHLLPQLRRLALLSLPNLSIGARLILWGLVKKAVLADRLATFAKPCFDEPHAHDPFRILTSIAAMLTVLYLDFSAYTDIARGSARLFGVDLVRNFDRPFLMRDSAELWKRWHISLNDWIADYVSAPLAPKKLTVLSIWRVNLIAMGLFGLWHGAAFKFIVIGLLLGVAISISHTARFRRRQIGARPAGPASRGRIVGRWCTTMLASALVIALFFARDLPTGLSIWRGLIPRELPSPSWFSRDSLAVVGLLALLLLGHASGALIDLSRTWIRAGMLGRTAWFAALVSVYAWLRVDVADPFVYFQF